MKVIEGSIMPISLDSEEEKEIIELIKKSTPSSHSELSILKISDDVGWTHIIIKINESEISIQYSSCMFDTSYLIKFLSEIIALEESMVLILDNEGSYPILYVEPINEDSVRFAFAHDYKLFLNDKIDDYKISDYEFEFDIIINKRELLEKFYNVLYPFTMNYNLEEAYCPEFELEEGIKYLNQIGIYLNK